MANNKNNKNKKPAQQVKPAAVVASADKLLEGKSLYVFLALASLVALVVFKDFIFLKNLYLYKDIGSDTISYSWPHYVELSRYIHTIGIPKWSFSQGLGQNIYPFGINDPFTLLLAMLSPGTIPYAIVFTEIIKIIGGGLFFYFYLRLINASLSASVIGGLLFSFSGYMILGSGWYLFSTEALYAAFILYSAEKYLRKGVWYLLPLAFCLLGMAQPFNLYLYGLLLVVYCAIRALVVKQWSWKDIVLPVFKIGLLAAFGVLLGSIVFFSNAHLLINNPRVSGGASMFHMLSSIPMFTTSPFFANFSALYRLFSNDLLGTGSNFKGLGNYLESPILYIGLPSLLLAPQAFLFFEKRKRRVFLIATAICIFPMAFIYFRFLFWLFAGDFYRSYTFFISLVILFFAIKAFSQIDRTGVVHTKTLFVTLAVLLLGLYANLFGNVASPVDKHFRNIIAFLLVLYTGIIYMMGNNQFKVPATIALVLLTCCELAGFSSITVNDRVVMKSEDLNQKRGYNDYSIEALDYIKTHDKSFYRIGKDYYSDAAVNVCLNDPEMQDFRGLTDYAEWNQSNYVSFLREMHTYNNADTLYAKWMFGPGDRVLLKTMANVKYHLSKLPKFDWRSSGYDSLGRFGDVHVYRNKFYLPLGYTYGKYIPVWDFRSVKNDILKDMLMLNAFVADSADMPAYSGLQQLQQTNLPPLTFESYRAYTNALKKDTLAITSFDENNIAGKIKLDSKKLLFLFIPYDKGWHITVDGKETTPYKVNIGFMGLLLDKGEHTVEMHYVVPLFAAGAATSAICILLYVFAFIKFGKRSF